ncbi:hypothetical protein AAF712_012916 [Marasmius tenuissimus]|uniref:Uncharacterized protein n=1 Tax=Marasmius tenuissimus TaxID=585030 RepID=A0ABR2ZG32_9AGAR
MPSREWRRGPAVNGSPGRLRRHSVLQPANNAQAGAQVFPVHNHVGNDVVNAAANPPPPAPKSMHFAVSYISCSDVDILNSNSDVPVRERATVMVVLLGSNRWIVANVFGGNSDNMERYLVNLEGVFDEVLRTYTLRIESFVGTPDGNVDSDIQARTFRFRNEVDYAEFKETLMVPSGNYNGLDDARLETAAFTAAWRALRVYLDSILIAREFTTINFLIEY